VWTFSRLVRTINSPLFPPPPENHTHFTRPLLDGLCGGIPFYLYTKGRTAEPPIPSIHVSRGKQKPITFLTVGVKAGNPLTGCDQFQDIDSLHELFSGTVKQHILTTCDRLCGLVVRVLGYRSRGPGSIPGATIFSRK
jgi:hypothetical protein